MASESPYKVGMLVCNTRVPHWGPGKILAIEERTATVYFRDVEGFILSVIFPFLFESPINVQPQRK